MGILGGLSEIRVNKEHWSVSDDILLHLSTAEALIEHGSCPEKKSLFSALARGHQRSMGDMRGRALGETCMMACAML